MSHVIIHKKLAQALLEHATQPLEHFDGGGIAGILGAKNNFDSQGPMQTSQNLTPQVAQQYGQQQDVYGQQQSLANTLLAQSQGQGPNPALAQLNQATGQNVNQQAALMASQRGAGANPALMARQAAQVGAGVQQAAVGQAATQQAQQQLAAQQQLQQQQAQMAGQSLQAQSILQGAIASQNNANMSSQGINAQVQGQNAAANSGILGGLISGGAAALGSIFNKGGEVKGYAVGGPVQPMGIQNYGAPQIPNIAVQAPQADPFKAGMTSLGGFLGAQMNQPQATNPYAGSGFDPQAMQQASMRYQAAQAGGIPMEAEGGPVPGEAEVDGDSPKNDTVKAMLSPGEVVLPRSVTMSKNPERGAVEFLRYLNANKKGYGRVIDSRRGA